MKLAELLKYSKTEKQQFISGGQEAELEYLKFHFKRFKVLMKLLGKIKPGKVLDIGTTPFAFYIQEKTENQVFAFDYNDLQKERCLQYNINFKSGDLAKNELPYNDNFFDTVIFAEVFEHIHSDPIKLLSNLKRVIKPQGVLVFGTPNMASLANRVKLLFNKPILDYPTWDSEVHGHDRIYLKTELHDYLAKAGFTIQKTSYSSSVDFIALANESKKAALIKNIISVLTKPFVFLFPSLKGTILIIAKKQ